MKTFDQLKQGDKLYTFSEVTNKVGLLPLHIITFSPSEGTVINKDTHIAFTLPKGQTITRYFDDPGDDIWIFTDKEQLDLFLKTKAQNLKQQIEKLKTL